MKNPAKKISKTVTLWGMLLLTSTAMAQPEEQQVAVPPSEFFQDQQFSVVQHSSIQELSERSVALKEAIYLNDDWLSGTLYTTTGQVLQNSRLRYDIKNDLMEVETPDGVKTLHGSYIKQFTLQEPGREAVYVSGDKNTVAEESHSCFYQVLVGGQGASLLSKTELYMQRANYVPQLDTGNKSARLLKKEHFYLARNKQLTKLDKDNYEAFGDKADEMKAYAKAKRLKLHKKENAKALISYYNTLP